LRGFVKNQTGSVAIEVEGDPAALARFLEELTERPPPLAKVGQIVQRQSGPQGDSEFVVESSEDDGGSPVVISPDVATCWECRSELLSPCDRGFGYPFLNCTNCGPRLTVITGAPYDRMRTTMASFALCAECSKEYHDPANRRFHAEPTACATCGPSLTL